MIDWSNRLTAVFFTSVSKTINLDPDWLQLSRASYNVMGSVNALKHTAKTSSRVNPSSVGQGSVNIYNCYLGFHQP